MRYLIGLDIGTSGVKGLLVDEEGNLIYSSFKGYPLYTPYPLWSEQDPRDWWDATIYVLSDIVRNSFINARDIKGIGLSGQMHSLVSLDKDYNIIRPAMLWCDQRTKKECDYVMDKIGFEKVIDIISNPVLPGFTLGKILWIRENEPKNYERIYKILLPKDYIRFKMTESLNMEITDAAGTAFFSVKEHKWAKEFLKTLDIPIDFLPPVCKSYEICGKTVSSLEELTGIKQGTPVVGGGADNACGAIGGGIIKEGRVLSSIGSSGVMLAPITAHKVDPRGRLHTFNHSMDDIWYLMGVELSAGMSLSWFRKENAPIETALSGFLKRNPYDILSDEASISSPGSNGVVFLPYLSGERTPHKDPYAKGLFFGISLLTKRGDLIRSIMEGVVFGLRDSLEIMKNLDVPINEIRAIGGGAKSKVWKQIQADIFQKEIKTMEKDEGPAYGAVILAGVGAGIFASIEEGVEKFVKIKEVIEPQDKYMALYNDYYEIYKKLYDNLKGLFKDIGKLNEKYQ